MVEHEGHVIAFDHVNQSFTVQCTFVPYVARAIWYVIFTITIIIHGSTFRPLLSAADDSTQDDVIHDINDTHNGLLINK